jgi:hypothetical protein
MKALFASGRAVDLILVVLVFEFLLLLAFRRTRYRSLIEFVAAVLPGICMLLALRVSLTGGSWEWIAFWLALSFPAHLVDLRLRAL